MNQRKKIVRVMMIAPDESSFMMKKHFCFEPVEGRTFFIGEQNRQNVFSKIEKVSYFGNDTDENLEPYTLVELEAIFWKENFSHLDMGLFLKQMLDNRWFMI